MLNAFYRIIHLFILFGPHMYVYCALYIYIMFISGIYLSYMYVYVYICI